MDDLQMFAVLAEPDPSGDVVGRGRDRLQNVIDGGPARRHRKAWAAGGLGLTAAAAAAAVVVASGVTAPTATPNSPPATALPSGRAVLLAAAATAERMPEGSGRYWYVRQISTEGDGSAPEVWESWTSRDGQMWHRGAKTDGELYKVPAKIQKQLIPFDFVGSKEGLKEILSLPTEPAALKAWIVDAVKRSDIRTSAGKPTASNQAVFVFNALVSLISTLPAPPKVRAAAFRAIAAYPDVKNLGPVRGGQGLLLFRHERQPVKLVVDTATGRVRDTNFLALGAGETMYVPEPGSVTVIGQWTDHLPE